MYLGLVWDTCKIHVKYQDTCILLECNRAFKIHLRYIMIHPGYMYSTGYTCKIHAGYIMIQQDTYPIGNPPQNDRNPPAPRVARSPPYSGRTEHDHDRRRHRCRVLPFVASRWLESPLGGVGVSLRSPPSRPRRRVRRSMLGNSFLINYR